MTAPRVDGGWPRHGILASLLAPLVAPLLYWLWYLPGASGPFEGVRVIFAVGAIMAYTAMLGVGLPAVALLAYFRVLNFGRVLTLGGISGLVAAQALGAAQQGAAFPAKFPLWLGAAIGLACAAAWWRIATTGQPRTPTAPGV